MIRVPSTLLGVLASVVAVVGAMLAVATAAIVGRERLAALRSAFRERLRTIGPSLAVLAVVLLLTRVARGLVPEVSWMIGLNVTGYIHALEGSFVAWVQSFASPPLTAYFSFMYVYGYVFLLVFPFVAYSALADPRALRELVVAYTANYAIGLVSYAVFIAYGPRNLMPDLVEPLLYTAYPGVQLLTSQVNTNTNVFPSLHTSLAVTVAVLAYRTREVYPGWLPVAGFFALSVAVSTMYLGIHWATDVVAGGLLAGVSVSLARYSVSARYSTGTGTSGPT